MFVGAIHLWTEEERLERHPAERIIFAMPVSPYESYPLSEAKDKYESLTSLADDPITPSEIAKIATGAWINDITV